MKVYIVTSGEHNDYSIEKVFLDKEKAEEYKRLTNNSWGSEEKEIEEWEVSDDKIEIGKYEIKKFINVTYRLDENKDDEEFSVRIMQDNTLNSPDINDYPYNYSEYCYYDWSNVHEVAIHRLYNNENIDKLKEKYLKICRDYVTKIKHIHDVEGMDYKDISKLVFIAE